MKKTIFEEMGGTYIRHEMCIRDRKKKDRIFTVTKSYLHHEMDRGAKAAGVKLSLIHI